MTNPDACKNCGMGQKGDSNTYTPTPAVRLGEFKIVQPKKLVKKTTETFDKDGKLVSRVLEEYEEQPSFVPTWTVTSDTLTAQGSTVTAKAP